MKSLLLIDLSSIAHPIWHMCGSDPNVDACSQKIVERVLQLASSFPHAAICCDAGRSFRNDLSPDYKAQRPERDAALMHQIELAVDALRAEGFPVWKVTGYEADDLIASATARAFQIDGCTVLIATGDKDLCQLVGPRVTVKRVQDGELMDTAAVEAKFGVSPTQMRDYLTLVGDVSDNVKGADGIGPKSAAKLLNTFRTLDALYTSIADGSAVLTPAVKKSLLEFHPNLATTRALITMSTDVALPFEEVVAERKPQAAHEGFAQAEQATGSVAAAVPGQPSEPVEAAETGLAVRAELLEAAPPAEWERQLDPRSMDQARTLATDMFKSRMFNSYGTPHAVLSTVMVGRELGLPAMASLMNIHNVDGKHSLSAALMVALVLKSGLAEYFEAVEFSDKAATFITKRKGARKEQTFTFTIEEARKAWKKSQDAWDKSGWGTYPRNMLIARAQSMLARLVYPDLLAGLYTPEELQEMREAA